MDAVPFTDRRALYISFLKLFPDLLISATKPLTVSYVGERVHQVYRLRSIGRILPRSHRDHRSLGFGWIEFCLSSFIVKYIV
jgi:hypothetical protein